MAVAVAPAAPEKQEMDSRVEMVAEVETTMAGLVVLVMEAVVAVQVLELIVTEMAEREPMETPE